MDIKNKPKNFISFNKIKDEQKITSHKIWIISYLFFAGIAIIIYFLLRLHVFKVFGIYLQTLQKIALGSFIDILILTIAKFLEDLLLKKTRVMYTRYNLTKMIRLLSRLLIVAVGISFLFKNWSKQQFPLGMPEIRNHFYG